MHAGHTGICRFRLLLGRTIAVVALAGLAPSLLSAQQTQTVSGTVRTEDGSPLLGASVSVPSLGVGVNTKTDGRYTLVVPVARVAGSTFTVTARAIGYKPQSSAIAVGRDATADFTLAPNPLQLGEVVTTGAGTVSEVEKIGNVRNSIDSSLIRKSNEANVVAALSAKAPNVEVSSASGDPGASASIRIRGANTLLGDGQPLFVVDGMPVDNSVSTTAALDPQTGGAQGGVSSPNRVADINPNDIESVEILKGAAAGAVYGARAGQGVILITTKRGKSGGTRYSLSSTVNLQDVRRGARLQRTFGQGDNGVADACATDPTQFDCSASENSWGPLLAAGTPTFDHSREVYRTGAGTENTLTISGGTDRTTFFVSGSQFNQNGAVVGPNSAFDRYSFRLKGDHLVFDNLKVGGNISYTNSRQFAVQKGFNFSGVTWGAWRTPPEFDNRQYLTTTPDSVQRSFRFPNPSFGNDFDSRGYDNPFWSAYNQLSTSIVGRAIGSIVLDWGATKWLNVHYSLGVDDGTDSRLEGHPRSTSNTPDPTGQVIKRVLVNTQWDHNLLATATYTLTPKLAGTVTLGQNLNTRSFRDNGQVGNGLIAPSPYNLSNTATQTPPRDIETKIRNAGYFAQGTLDVDNQLFLKGGLRYDGASTFSRSQRWAWFPSASGAWTFTNAINGGNVLSFGKARVAYGEVGTQPTPYLSAVVYRSGLFNDFDGFGTGVTQNGIGGLASPATQPATGLKPERTRELEAGVDLGLFKDLADLSFTWYYRKSVDVILPIPVAASTGYQTQFANGAKIRNAGTEIALNIRPITRKDFAWDVGIILGTNRNRVLDLRGAEFVDFNLAGGGGIQAGAEAVAQVGQPIGVFRDYDYVRCGNGVVLTDGSGQPYSVDAGCTAEQRATGAVFITDGTFANANGDRGAGAGYPLLDPTQRVVGDPNPKWTGSVRTGVRVGRLSFSGLLDIRHGGVVWNGTRAALNGVGAGKDTEKRGQSVVFGSDFLPGAVAGPGAGSSVPLTQEFFQNYYSWSFTSTIGSPFYESASFVRLRELSVAYSLGGEFVNKKLGFSSVDLRLSGRNLALWTKYTGADPETNLAGAETGARGIDFFNNPQSRSFVFSVVLNR